MAWRQRICKYACHTRCYQIRYSATFVNKILYPPFQHDIQVFLTWSLIIGIGLIDWLVCCLLAGPDLWKRMPLKCSKCFITEVFTCPLLSWCTISSPIRENNNVVVFPLLFHIMPLANLWIIRLQRIVFHPKDKKLPWPLPAHPHIGIYGPV